MVREVWQRTHLDVLAPEDSRRSCRAGNAVAFGGMVLVMQKGACVAALHCVKLTPLQAGRGNYPCSAHLHMPCAGY